MLYPENLTEELRMRFAHFCDPNYCGNGIESVVMPGAITEENGQLSEPDMEHLDYGFSLLNRSNTPIAPSFNLTTVNINAEFGAEDYLSRHKYKSDLVFVSFISNGSHYLKPHRSLKGSIWHNLSGSWTRAAIRSGAKAIISAQLVLPIKLCAPEVSSVRFLERPRLFQTSPFVKQDITLKQENLNLPISYDLMFHRDFVP